MGKNTIFSNSSYTSIREIRRQLLRRAKLRAIKKGIPFNITIEDIVLPKNYICPIMKKRMVTNTKYAPSLDKKEPLLGYVKGNVFVISTLANNLKGNASKEEIKTFCKYIKKYML